MKIDRVWAMPSAWTFTIKPIKKLLNDYVENKGKGWVDPFAGDNSPAEYTNDIHPERKAKYHMDAEEFCASLVGEYVGVIFDPPYSYRQITEHYKQIGKKATQLDTSSNFYNRVMNAICNKIKVGGHSISCGWNSNGFGKNRGFEIVEILLVAHGGHHNDTIVTVEKKLPHPIDKEEEMREKLVKIISKVLNDDLPWLETDLDEFAGRIADAILSKIRENAIISKFPLIRRRK